MDRNNYSFFIVKNIVLIIMCSHILTLNDILYADISISGFIQHGRMLYGRGDVYGAIDDFAHALLLDINNKEAQSDLFDFIYSPDIKINDRMFLLKIKAGIDYIRNLERRIAYYNKQINVVLRKRSHKKIKDISFDLYGEDAYYRGFNMPVPAEKGYIQEDGILGIKKGVLSRLYFVIENKNEFLKKRLLVLKQKYYILKQQDKGEIDRKDRNDSRGKVLYSDRHYYLKNNYKSKRVERKTFVFQNSDGSKQKTRFNVDIDNVKRNKLLNQFNKLKEYITKQEQEIVRLKKQLSMNLGACSCEEKLSKDGCVSDNDVVKQLNAKVMELKARMALSEKIIEDKDYKIKELKKLAYHKSCDKQCLGKDEIRRLQGLLDIYKAKLEEMVKKRDEAKQKIEELQQKIAGFSYQEKRLCGIKEEVSILQKELYNLKDRIILLQKKSLHKTRLDKGYSKEVHDLKSKLDDIDRFLRHELIGLDEIISNSHGMEGID